MNKIISILIISLFFVSACTKQEAKKTDKKQNQAKETTETAVKKEKTYPLNATHIQQEYYDVKFDFPKDLKADEQLTFNILATPKKDRHINTGFPVSLTFEDSCFTFEKPKFKGKDAKALEDTKLAFALTTSCKKQGKHALKGNLKFGYCTDELCYTYNAPFKFDINIK